MCSNSRQTNVAKFPVELSEQAGNIARCHPHSHVRSPDLDKDRKHYIAGGKQLHYATMRSASPRPTVL